MASSTSAADSTLRSYESHASSVKEFRSYLSKDTNYVRLSRLQEEVWNSQEGDKHFAERYYRADHASNRDQQRFLRMMVRIGDQLNIKTSAFQLPSAEPKVLDFCMAPGGFVKTALKINENAKVESFSLPPEQGGHRVLIARKSTAITFMDVTMFAGEFGLPDVPEHQTEWAGMRQEWPYSTSHYDLIICDGAVLRKQYPEDHKASIERVRLTCAQLYLGLKRIRNGGNMITLLHKTNNLRNFRLIHMFYQFSSVQLFKPLSAHTINSSFYLVAKDVESDSQACLEAMALFKTIWEYATFDSASEETFRLCTEFTLQENSLSLEVEEFGPRYIESARPIWNIQAAALDKQFVTKKSSTNLQPLPVTEPEKICTHYLRGRCRYGASCYKSHDASG
ncbi:NAD(P)-binding protein [Aureobasidium pullulans]|nr:NAD(P)-binding protein [Aureobasidium pullulans]